jgi:hypothetical protein
MKRYAILLLLIPLLLTSCEKEDLDYRYKFTGKYHYEIGEHSTTFVGDPSTGHFVTTITNSTYNGSVRVYLLQSNMLKVDWGTATFDVDGVEIDQHKTFMTVDKEGNLYCPDVTDGFFGPPCIHGDTIHFKIFAGGGMAHQVGTLWYVTGLKK